MDRSVTSNLTGSIARRWDGSPAAPGELPVEVEVRWSALGATVLVAAPYFGDVAPVGPAGQTWQLWEHEVVEVFLLGPDERYTEIELGPHGHWLVLELHGVRRVTSRVGGLTAHCQLAGDRWSGSIDVPWSALPDPIEAWNAYAIHGAAGGRHHRALFAVPGAQADFHRLGCFQRLAGPVLASQVRSGQACPIDSGD